MIRSKAGLRPPLAGLLASAAALGAALVVVVMVRLAGRERLALDGPAEATTTAPDAAPRYRRVDAGRLAASVTPASSLPEELNAAQGGILLAERVEKRHKVVWLIDTAVDGHLSITGSEDRPVLKRPASKVTPRPDEMTTAVLDRIFCGEDSVSLGSYDPNFSTAWGLLDSGLDEWRRASGLWHPAGDRRRRYALWLGVLATFTVFVFSGGSGIGDGGGVGAPPAGRGGRHLLGRGDRPER